ncbi:MAG TPA: transposase, partial [Gemmatimonadaceae bacterium]|nr:transposase [Gemmatimonadaceae bacterium]
TAVPCGMNDRQLYEQILGIQPPWSVSDVELCIDDGDVLITVSADAEVNVCPQCGEPSGRSDHEERRWRHLNTCQLQTVLRAFVPRVHCSTHGVRQIRVPWADERSRFTALFEALVIDWLRCTENIAAVATGLDLTWDEVDGIRTRAVRRGLQRRGRAPLPTAIGVDETSITRGHEYITVVTALDEPRVLEASDERTQASLAAFWTQYTPPELARIAHIAMDMWDPYIAATRAHVPDADAKIEHAAQLWGYVRPGMAARLWRHWLHGALSCHVRSSQLAPTPRLSRMTSRR